VRGGVFLNCQMNGRIVRETRFENLHVVPAAGDDGQCIGSAFFAYAQAFAPPQRGADPLPYLGPHYDRAAITQDIQRAELSAEELEDGQLMERIAQALADGLIVGLFRGRSECGPRALCHRSLLADPRRADMKDRLNGLKGRELFRPFAPAVTEEDQATFFELEPPSPFMLVATALRPRFRDVLPAITHIDGSARVQAVSRAKEPFIHALLRAFAARTGYPVLLNTSFKDSRRARGLDGESCSTPISSPVSAPLKCRASSGGRWDGSLSGLSRRLWRSGAGSCVPMRGGRKGRWTRASWRLP
jgi:carbamoyltransferase